MVRASRHRRDRTMSVLLLTIVMVFIICNTARVTINLFEAVQVNIGKESPALSIFLCNGREMFQMYEHGDIKEWPAWINHLTRINHVLLAFNSSINIVIYTAKVSRFC